MGTQTLSAHKVGGLADHCTAAGATQALNAMALLSAKQMTAVCLQRGPIWFGHRDVCLCNEDPECRERYFARQARVLLETIGTGLQYDLARAAWLVSMRGCLLRGFSKGLRNRMLTNQHLRHFGLAELS